MTDFNNQNRFQIQPDTAYQTRLRDMTNQELVEEGARSDDPLVQELTARYVLLADGLDEIDKKLLDLQT